MKRKNFFSGIAIAVLLLLSTLSLHVDAAVVNLGDVVPDFTLKDMDGNTHNLYEFEGSVILFNIFGVT
jgi:hypothetical protein